MFGEILRNVDDAIGIASADLLLGLFHIGAVPYDAYFGCGIYPSQVFAAQCRVRSVHHHGRHIAYHFMAVYIAVEEWVQEGHYDEKDDHTHVSERLAQLVPPYGKEV